MSSQWESVDRMEARESRRKWQEEEMRRTAEMAPALDDEEWLKELEEKNKRPGGPAKQLPTFDENWRPEDQD